MSISKIGVWGLVAALISADWQISRAQSFIVLPREFGSAEALSADGEWVVGWKYDEGGRTDAARWNRRLGLQALGTFGGTSFGTLVSADGSVIYGGAFDGQGGFDPFRWTPAGGMKPTVEDSVVTGCSSDGKRYIGYFYVSDVVHAYRKQVGSPLTELVPGTTIPTVAAVCSADARVVFGIAYFEDTETLFRWSPSSGAELLGGIDAAALDCSDDGTTLVGSTGRSDRPGQFPFRYTDRGGFKLLGSLGGTFGDARFCSEDGSVIAGISALENDAAYRAFIWTSQGKMRSLGSFGRNYSLPNCMSASGDAIGGTAFNTALNGAGERHVAFLWRKGIGGKTLVSVLKPVFGQSATRWKYESVEHISADGRALVVKASKSGNAPRLIYIRLPRERNVSEERSLTPSIAAAVAESYSAAWIASELDPDDPVARQALELASIAAAWDAEARDVAADFDDQGEAFGSYYSARARSYVASSYVAAYGGEASAAATVLLKHDLQD